MRKYKLFLISLLVLGLLSVVITPTLFADDPPTRPETSSTDDEITTTDRSTPPYQNPLLSRPPMTYDDIPGAPIAINATTGCGGNEFTRTITVPDSFTVLDVDFGFNADHVYRGDIVVVLESPLGTQVEIMSANGGDGNANYDLLLDDASVNALNDGDADVTAAPFYDRTAAPSNPMSVFIGENSLGDWLVHICDSFIASDDGAYNRSQLTLEAPVTCGPDEIAGTAFRDFNGDALIGTYDSGVYNVTISAYEAGSSTPVATATTDTLGAYSLTGLTAATEYRIEFDWSQSYLSSGPAGSTSTQFVTSGTCSTDFGLQNPAQYCQADPLVSVSCYDNGDGVAGANTNPGYVSFPYSSSGQSVSLGGGTADPNYDAEIQEIGTVWGAAYQRESARLFAAAFVKRHAGLGPLAPHTDTIPGIPGNDTFTVDGVYILDYGTASVPMAGGFNLDGLTPDNGGAPISLGVITRTVDINNILDDDYELAPGTFTQTIDLNAFAQAGLVGYGDIDITEDDDTLWLVNLNDRALISVDVSNPAVLPPAATVNQYPIDSLPGVPSCTGGVLRAWGLKFHDGLGYLGAVCTAETSQLDTDLQAYILSFDPNNPTAGFATELSFGLNYNREPIADGLASAFSENQWQAWTRTWADTGMPVGGLGEETYPQPIISDIEFSEDGSMQIGVIDRWGHQMGLQEPYPVPGGGGELVTGDAGGDLWHACYDPVTDVYTLEGNGTCLTSDAGAGASGLTNDGPSNTGEYYHEDIPLTSIDFHYEVTTGGLAQHASSGEILSTTYDPILENFTQGVQMHASTSGSYSDAYEFIAGSLANYGKANGLGDPELICEPAPLEVGNRLWCDDGDGIQDPSEANVGTGISVVLTCGADLPVTVTTDATGSYLFTDADYQAVNGTNIPRNSACTISVDTTGANGAAIASACGFPAALPTLPNVEGDNTNDPSDDVRDSDAVQGIGNVFVDITTGDSGDNNHSLDIGFAASAAPTDWGDLPDSFDTSTATGGPQHGVAPDLYLGDCVDSESDGQADAEAGTDPLGGDDNAVGGTTEGTCATPGDDEDGVTLATPLIPGAQACVDVSTVNGTGGSANLYGWFDFNGDGDFDGDADDLLSTGDFTGGSVSISAGVGSQQYCFTVPAGATFDGGETHMRFRLTTDVLGGGTPWGGPASDGEVEDYYQPLACVGNYVWNDANGDGDQDGGEAGQNGVGVDLVWAGPDGIIGTGDDVTYSTTTANDGVTDGTYNFCGLTGGNDYQIQIPTPPAGFPLATTQDAGTATDFTDSDGSQPGGIGGSVSGPTFTVPDPISLPTGENGTGDNPGSYNNFPDGQDDISFDFGFLPAPVDWGDLPDTFDTTTATGGPAHGVVSNLYLGDCVDSDNDGQPDAEAGSDGTGGDDNAVGGTTQGTCATAGDDEDGVTLTTPLIPGTQACVDVSAVNGTGGAANLYGWFDFNGDGDFDGDADDLLSTGDFTGGSVSIPAGGVVGQQYCFTVPAGATFDGGETHMRFRLTTDVLGGGTPWGGPASDGEVEDYYQQLACVGNHVWHDFNGNGIQDPGDPGLNGVGVNLVWAGPDGILGNGDDVTYSTTSANDGLTDGMYNFCGLTPGTYQTSVPVLPTGLDATLPNNGTTDFDDSDGTQPGGAGTPALGPTFTVGDPIILPTGENGTGDVPGSYNNFPDDQDDISFDFGFANYDYGDNPDTYETTNGNNGARHTLNTTHRLGSCVDAELDGQPSATASGDDGNVGGAPTRTDGACVGGVDEDGVTFPMSGDDNWSDGDGQLIVDVVGDGCLNVWLDFTDGTTVLTTGDGDFDDIFNDGTAYPEHVIQNQVVTTGTGQNFSFALPAGAGDSADWYTRIRLTPRDAGGLCTGADTYEAGVPTPGGNARGGEVEDYRLTLGPTAINVQQVVANAPQSTSILAIIVVTLVSLSLYVLVRRKQTTA